MSHATGQVVASYLKFAMTGPPRGSTRAERHNQFTLGVGERGVAAFAGHARAAERRGRPARRRRRAPPCACSARRGASPTRRRHAARRRPADRRAASSRRRGARPGRSRPARAAWASPSCDAVRDYAFDFTTAAASTPASTSCCARRRPAARSLAARRRARARAERRPWQLRARRRQVAASGPDFLTFAVGSAGDAARAVVLRDGAGRVDGQRPARAHRTCWGRRALRWARTTPRRWLGLVAAPLESRYTIEVLGSASDTFAASVTLPRGDGTFVHAQVVGVPLAAGSRSRLLIDLASPDSLVLETDVDGDGVFETQQPRRHGPGADGPAARRRHVIGPETLTGASPFGYRPRCCSTARSTPASAAVVGKYAIPSNRVEFAKAFTFRAARVRGRSTSRRAPTSRRRSTASGIADARGDDGPEATVALARSSRTSAPS